MVIILKQTLSIDSIFNPLKPFYGSKNESHMPHPGKWSPTKLASPSLTESSLASPAHTPSLHPRPLLHSPGFLEGLSAMSPPSLSSFAFAVPKTQDAFCLEPPSSLRSQRLMKTLDLIDSNKPVAITSPCFNSLQSTSHCYFSVICFVGLAVLDKLSFPQNLNSDKRNHATFSLQDISQRPTDTQAPAGWVLRAGGPLEHLTNKSLPLPKTEGTD